MEVLVVFKNNSRFFDCFKYELRETELELFDKNGFSIISFNRSDIEKYSIWLK